MERAARPRASYVRYVPWFPHTTLAVPELEPPQDGKTSWDFSVIDPVTLDFLDANQGRPFVMNFATIPVWMFKTAKPVTISTDPRKLNYDYNQGTELRDPTMKQVADYFARIVSWYSKGGFTDELGCWHESGHHFQIPYWEVLNEPDLEHHFSAEVYTKLYDAVVEAMQGVTGTKFVGISLPIRSGHRSFSNFS